MNEGSRVVMGAVMGAAIGAATGYLFFTERGRRVREQIDPSLDTLRLEMHRLRGTINKAVSVASEGWELLNEIAGERRPPAATWPATPRQTSPF